MRSWISGALHDAWHRAGVFEMAAFIRLQAPLTLLLVLAVSCPAGCPIRTGCGVDSGRPSLSVSMRERAPSPGFLLWVEVTSQPAAPRG